MSLKDLNIDSSWSLFLDRDGVINKRIVDGYVTTWKDFKFLPGVKQALKSLGQMLGRIVIVTNQQGIGKGFMTEENLLEIHQQLIGEIVDFGGRIDNIYHCPFRAEENSYLRKPAPGMAYLAQEDFPEISFEKSIMVGDSTSDMQFGKNMGMSTVLISDDFTQVHDRKLVDFQFTNLLEFSKVLID